MADSSLPTLLFQLERVVRVCVSQARLDAGSAAAVGIGFSLCLIFYNGTACLAKREFCSNTTGKLLRLWQRVYELVTAVTVQIASVM